MNKRQTCEVQEVRKIRKHGVTGEDKGDEGRFEQGPGA